MDNYWGNSFLFSTITIQNNGLEPGLPQKILIFTFGKNQNDSHCEPSKIQKTVFTKEETQRTLTPLREGFFDLKYVS